MTNRAAAIRYARALFDVALKESDVQRVDVELAEFSALVEQHPPLKRILANPAVPASRKHGVIGALLEHVGGVTPALAKLLLMLADRDRLVLLPEMAVAYRDRLQQHQGVVRAEVTTAVALPLDRLSALERGLVKASGRAVALTTRIDATVLGGAVTRIGSMVYDGSVARQLERLRDQLTRG